MHFSEKVHKALDFYLNSDNCCIRAGFGVCGNREVILVEAGSGYAVLKRKLGTHSTQNSPVFLVLYTFISAATRYLRRLLKKQMLLLDENKVCLFHPRKKDEKGSNFPF